MTNHPDEVLSPRLGRAHQLVTSCQGHGASCGVSTPALHQLCYVLCAMSVPGACRPGCLMVCLHTSITPALHHVLCLHQAMVPHGSHVHQHCTCAWLPEGPSTSTGPSTRRKRHLATTLIPGCRPCHETADCNLSNYRAIEK